jgi:hypothetical protein
MTDAGKEKFRQTKTGYNVKELSNGVFKQKDWNDPLLLCDPTGFPRIMWNSAKPGMRFLQTPEEVIQFFEDGRTWRDLWTDGRKLPGDNAEARWFGYAVAHWDGDTFVVNSMGYDDRSWLDQYGSPHSDQLRIEERYHRPDHDHLEMFLDMTDPMTYTGTWKGDKKIFQWVEKPARSQFSDLPEGLCVWSEVKDRVGGAKVSQ